MRLLLLTFLLSITNSALAIDSQRDLPIHYDLVSAGDKPVALLGNQVLQGHPAPDFKVVDSNFEPKRLSDYVGKPILISVVASLDTGVCSVQTKRFNQELLEGNSELVILTISTDLPFAQKRFCQAESVDQVVVLSDAVWRDFGTNYGILIKDMGLLSRAIFVINSEGTLIYKEIVPQLSDEPDYQTALEQLSIEKQHPESTELGSTNTTE